MKRSEMRQKLAELFKNVKHRNSSDEELAEFVLIAVEGFGMKPPVEKRCPVLLTNTHAWEPENAKS
jgi:hypothetical protein